MITSYATAQYQEMQVQTTPGKLVVMAYDGALRFLHLGLDAMNRGDRAAQGTYLGKAQAVIAELHRTLNLNAGPIAHNLRSIYTYLLTRLLTANAYDDAAPVEEAIRLMSDLRDAWDQAEKKVCAEMGELLPAGVAG